MQEKKTSLLLIAAAFVILSVLCIFRMIDMTGTDSLEATAVTITRSSAVIISDPVNINTASLEELMTLKEVGEDRAQAIIDYREKNGFFIKAEELKNVYGIGEMIFEMNRDRIIT